MATLTIAERQSLANQYRILALLDPDNENHYLVKSKIFDSGYEGLYSEAFEVDPEEVPAEIKKELYSILTMYRRINAAIQHLLSVDERDSLDLAAIHFEGFDMNNDTHHRLMNFVVSDLGDFQEYKGEYLNSHSSSSLRKYRQMLAVYEDLERRGVRDYDKNVIQEYVDAVKFH